MALTTFTPPIAPSPGTSRKPTLAILRADFGDGYSQSAADGLNHIRKNIELRWDVLSQAQAKAITDFLEARGGTEPFLYKYPHNPATLKYTCEDWQVNDDTNGLCSLSATFKQSFNLAS